MVSIAVGDSLGVLPGRRLRLLERHLPVSIAVGDSLGVLRKQSSRRTPSKRCFNRGGRFFGGAAEAVINAWQPTDAVSIAVGDSLGVLHELEAPGTFNLTVSIAVGDSLGVLLDEWNNTTLVIEVSIAVGDSLGVLPC